MVMMVYPKPIILKRHLLSKVIARFISDLNYILSVSEEVPSSEIVGNHRRRVSGRVTAARRDVVWYRGEVSCESLPQHAWSRSSQSAGPANLRVGS